MFIVTDSMDDVALALFSGSRFPELSHPVILSGWSHGGAPRASGLARVVPVPWVGRYLRTQRHGSPREVSSLGPADSTLISQSRGLRAVGTGDTGEKGNREPEIIMPHSHLRKRKFLPNQYKSASYLLRELIEASHSRLRPDNEVRGSGKEGTIRPTIQHTGLALTETHLSTFLPFLACWLSSESCQSLPLAQDY